MKTNPLPLNLQLFADPPADPPADGDEGADNPQTFDDLLKNKDYQAEFDRRITKALETARAKWQTEQDAAVEAAKTEAEKLAKMNAEQKAQHEREQKEKELAEREAALTLRELKAQAATTLAEKGLPTGLLDSLSYADADACQKSIDAVEKAFRDAVQAGVDERLKGKEPPRTGGGTTVPPDPKNMTYSERAELYARDKEAYERTFGRS
ncbi:MAG: DUF4355 domain-containing protein [Christensenellales bacterium]|jgi:hypothetical protein